MPNAISLAWCWWGLRGRTRIATATGRTGWGLWLTKIHGLQLRPKVKTKSWSWYPCEPDSYHFGFVYSPVIHWFNRMVAWMFEWLSYLSLNCRFFSHFAELYSTSCAFRFVKDMVQTRHRFDISIKTSHFSIQDQFQVVPFHPQKNAWSETRRALPSSFSSGFSALAGWGFTS